MGAGPGGMEAARIAALRGHRVTLFESTSELGGGQLKLATHAPFKEEYLNVKNFYENQFQKLDNLKHRLVQAGLANINTCRDALARSAALLDAVSPLSTLARGYSIVRKGSGTGKVVTDYRDVEVNDRVEVTLHHGLLQCTIQKTGKSRFNEVATPEGSEKKGSIED